MIVIKRKPRKNPGLSPKNLPWGVYRNGKGGKALVLSFVVKDGSPRIGERFTVRFAIPKGISPLMAADIRDDIVRKAERLAMPDSVQDYAVKQFDALKKIAKKLRQKPLREAPKPVQQRVRAAWYSYTRTERYRSRLHILIKIGIPRRGASGFLRDVWEDGVASGKPFNPPNG